MDVPGELVAAASTAIVTLAGAVGKLYVDLRKVERERREQAEKDRDDARTQVGKLMDMVDRLENLTTAQTRGALPQPRAPMGSRPR